MQLETLEAPVRDYINDITAKFKQQINEIEKQNQALHIQQYKTINELIEYKNKYLEIKEQLDLLIYKKFGRSAEQLLSDDRQLLLFTPEAEEAEIISTEKPELAEVVYSRSKDPRVHKNRSRSPKVRSSTKTWFLGII